MTDAVVVRGLDASYGHTQVLRGLDLDIPGGQLACILGPSGCGKTTLLRVLAGFLPAQAGTVTIAGHIVDDGQRRVPAEKRRVGYVPQEAGLFPHLTVAANIGFGLGRHNRALRTIRRRRVDDLLELVGLNGLAERHPHQLSGGQAQRVALARALATDPQLVLLDEPFAALDASLRRRLRLDVRAALAATGVTALLVTHDQTEALSLGDHVVLMRDGQVLQAGPPADLYARPADDWAAGFLGDATLLPADIHDGFAHTTLGRLPVTTSAGLNGGAVQVVIRPEQVVVTGSCGGDDGADGGGARGDRPLTGRIKRAEYYGHDALVEITIIQPGHDTTLIARLLGPAQPPKAGDTVTVAIEGPVQAIPATLAL